ncbi:MAG: response regulator [Rhodobacter sp.]|nr:response regulator [Rhodobacter sp.]
MRVLIVESNPELAKLWAGYLERHGAEVLSVACEADAIDTIRDTKVDILVLDLVLDHGSAFAVADFASYSQPLARVIFVTNTSFFSDGSIFRHIPNACAFLPSATAPEDLAAVIDYYGVAQ